MMDAATFSAAMKGARDGERRKTFLRAAELVEEGAGVADCAVEMARENGDEEEARICERIAASKRQEAARLRQEAGGE